MDVAMNSNFARSLVLERSELASEASLSKLAYCVAGSSSFAARELVKTSELLCCCSLRSQLESQLAYCWVAGSHRSQLARLARSPSPRPPLPPSAECRPSESSTSPPRHPDSQSRLYCSTRPPPAERSKAKWKKLSEFGI